MQILLQVFIEKHKKTCPYMWRFIAGLSAAVRNTEWAEKKIKIAPHVFYNSAKVNIRQ